MTPPDSLDAALWEMKKRAEEVEMGLHNSCPSKCEHGMSCTGISGHWQEHNFPDGCRF